METRCAYYSRGVFGFDTVGGLFLGLFETLLRLFYPRQEKEKNKFTKLERERWRVTQVAMDRRPRDVNE